MSKFEHVLVRLNKTASTHTCLKFLDAMWKSWLPRKVQNWLVHMVSSPGVVAELPPCVAEDLSNLPYATQVFTFEWRGL